MYMVSVRYRFETKAIREECSGRSGAVKRGQRSEDLGQKEGAVVVGVTCVSPVIPWVLAP